MKLIFFSMASGSSGNCYYLGTPEYGILIDAGISIRTIKKVLKDRSVDMSQIMGVLVTHDHADHIKSVGCISKDFHIPVYATATVHHGIERNYCVRAKVPVGNKHVIENGIMQKLGNFNITSFHVPHDSMDCVGYQIEHEGMTIVLATDVGEITDEIRKAISVADYLIIEANHDEAMLMSGPYSAYLKQRVSGPNGHLSNKNCAKVIAEEASEKLKHIWLCHLSEENNHPELARITIEQTLAEAGKPIGDSLKLDVLKRKIPTGVFKLTSDNEQD